MAHILIHPKLGSCSDAAAISNVMAEVVKEMKSKLESHIKEKADEFLVKANVIEKKVPRIDLGSEEETCAIRVNGQKVTQWMVGLAKPDAPLGWMEFTAFFEHMILEAGRTNTRTVVIDFTGIVNPNCLFVKIHNLHPMTFKNLFLACMKTAEVQVQNSNTVTQLPKGMNVDEHKEQCVMYSWVTETFVKMKTNGIKMRFVGSSNLVAAALGSFRFLGGESARRCENLGMGLSLEYKGEYFGPNGPIKVLP